MNQKNNSDQLLEDCHAAVMKEMDRLMGIYDPQIVASTMLAIALRLYKTVLTPEDFRLFMETVEQTSNNISEFRGPTIN